MNFFRKTREKIANENKSLKYLRYAVGEIFLVVIGILIALQVNNWNEERKNKNIEHQVLIGLLNDLKTNEKILNDAETIVDKQINQTKLILELMQEKPTDSLLTSVSKLLYQGTEVQDVQLNLAGIQGVINNKMELISNITLKQLIIKYPVFFEGYKEQESLMRALTTNRIRPGVKSYIFLENISSGSNKFSSDYKGLLSDRALANDFTDRKWESVEWKEDLLVLKEQGEILIKLIEEELQIK